MDEIKKSLKNLYNFSDIQIEAFVSKLITKRISKKDFLLEPSKTCNFIAFILKGSFRFFSRTDSEEHTLYLYTENNWIADYESLIQQNATNNYIQALEDSELEIISLANIHLLMEEYAVFRNLFVLLNKWVIPSSHYISISQTSPDDRYKKLLIEHPEWVNRFPQMYIASYLGMTKETFSRVKARIY